MSAVAEIAARLVGPDGLTEKRSTFSGTEAVMAWPRRTAGRPAEHVLALVERFLARRRLHSRPQPSVARRASRPPSSCATSGAHSSRYADPRSPCRLSPTLEHVFREQAAALGASSGDGTRRRRDPRSGRLRCRARRCGKTIALGALAEAFQREGYLTLGAAPSGVAAANLEAETGVPSMTLHRLLAEARGRGGLPRGCLLLVDEAGMADTRTLTASSSRSSTRTASRSLSATPPSSRPSGWAAASERSSSATSGIELRDNRRQRDELERRALALLRLGRSHDYLAHAAERGTFSVAGNRTEAKAQLVADGWREDCADPPGSAMIAYRRADVAELNAVARTLLDREGRLGRPTASDSTRPRLAVGDRILCTRNGRRLAVSNGTRSTVSEIDEGRQAIRVDPDDGRRLALPADYLEAGNIVHAYALTGHEAEGLTVEQAFVLADDRRALKEWGYVALSRAREQTRLYTISNELEPDAPPQRLEPAGPVDRLAGGARSPRRRNARPRGCDAAKWLARPLRSRQARAGKASTH